MAKQKNLSVPKVGMNRSTSPHLLQEGEYAFQLNGNSYDEGGEKFNLTDEHSNILATKYKDGFKFIGGKNHVVRNKTYIFLTNPTTGVSEIGCIRNTTEFTFEADIEAQSECTDCPQFINVEATPLEEQTQVPHQIYETLLEDSCNLCLQFDVKFPIVDIIIKEQNIGTKMFWTSTPGNNEFRYVELDDLEKYKVTGDDNCGAIPEDTCLDCDKLRVFRLYTELKVKDYERTLGGNLKKGSYEVLGAYSDILGNEFTSYVSLTPIIPIFDEANIIHEQVDNNAETNFSIKVELDNVDIRFDYYKIAVRYFTSRGVFTTFVEGIHNTSDKTIIISDNGGQSINNTTLTLARPFVETVDGATASNNILLLNGVREREPINLQPVMNLAGLGVKWMSFRAKEDLYANADSYKYLGYNRDENVALAIDFGMKDGYRTSPYIFIPRPATTDELADFTAEGDDYDSIISAAENCDGNLRTRKWQFYNTAFESGFCPLREELPTVTQTENVTTYTTVEVPSVPAGAINGIDLTQTEDFIDVRTFVEDNIDNSSVLGPIAPYVDLLNLTGFNNLPNLPAATCSSFTLIEPETINVTNVTNGKMSYVYPPDAISYVSVAPPANVNLYEINTSNGNSEIDHDFSYAYNSEVFNSSDFTDKYLVHTRKRKTLKYNTKCSQAEELQRVQDGKLTNLYGTYYPQNAGALSLVSLQDASVTMTVTQGTPTDVYGAFTDKLHKNALWFKTKVFGRNKFYINLSENSSCKTESFLINDVNVSFGVNRPSLIRVSIFAGCNESSPLLKTDGTPASYILDLNSANFITVDSSIINELNTDSLYISVETPIKQAQGLGPDWKSNNWVANANTLNPSLQNGGDVAMTTTFISNIYCGAWNIVDRDEEAISAKISWDEIALSKSQKYTTTCEFELPLLKECEPVPYKYGELGYYESTDAYPDNAELYDSSVLTINKNRITNVDLLEKIDVYKQSETSTEIVLSKRADFRCQNIRHYRLPDNQVSPFIGTDNVASNSDSVISPLGFTIDGEVITNMLNVALDNGLITQEQRDNIVDYKIYRSDTTLDRSIVASGVVFNTKKYTVEGDNIHYFNYPFNSLGKDKYYPNNTDDDFDKMQAISPEFDYFRPSLPTEMSLQGFMFGKSNSRVLPVKDHAKMVILGAKARNLANTLAIIEVSSEILIASSQAASNAQVWFTAGTSSGVSTGLPAFIAAGAIAAIGIVEGLVSKVARYRFEWEQTFENLGSPYNFGYYLAAGSNYNYLKTLQIDGDRLRGLSVRKYLKSGMLNVSDTVSGNVTKINNIDREEAPFFSLGDYPINNLSPEYATYDNSDTNPNFSSQVLSSEVGCHQGKSPEQVRNIASPYVAFKNYIPNQYGTVNSIKWVDTTFCFPITEAGICNGILGGDTFISRHSKKRKARLFETDLLGATALTPFPYKYNSNYGDARYYIDYKVNSEFQSGNKLFPSIFYDVQFDCNTTSNKFYIEPPGKFYLYNISFTNFLCETRINTNFRNARKEPWNQFYPQNTDYETITQPTTVSLTKPENYFYNKAYLQTDILNTVFTLPEYYSREDEALKAYNKNDIIYSLPDVNENSITEPWLLYRPNDRATLDSTKGELINMKGIESDQILLYFEDALQLQNSVNKFTDGSTQYNKQLGDGGIFAKRAITLRSTDLGYGGTQSKHTLSCEFGHFHVDLKRGQVFNYTGGTDMQEISRYSNGKTNGMDIWFKEHLPLKILKAFPDFEDDNPYNGVGIHWGFDSKYRRVILTKKDYIPNGKVTNCGKDFYDLNLDNYVDIIEAYQEENYTFEGVENCQLKFTKKGIPSQTDIYSFFDGTSMQYADALDASSALRVWFSEYQVNNPTYEGKLYIIPYYNEQWINYLNLVHTGEIAAAGGQWEDISILPPNLLTPEWVPPKNVVILAFIDETHPYYHNSELSLGFSAEGTTEAQPTDLFRNHVDDFVFNYENNFDFFKGVMYPIVQDNKGEALILHVMAAMEASTMTPTEITNTGATLDLSILETENPYSNMVALKNYDWKAVYNKTSPASGVFNSSTFSTELNELVFEGAQKDELVYVPLKKIELTDNNYFKDASFTVTYKPETGSWESYMSYTPNYYINHTDYFQSGINSEDQRHGLWSHLLSNKSYRVFYGQKFPYIIEYPIKNEYFSKRLESISWSAQLRRYHNEYDYAPIEANPFTSVTVFNNYESSGELTLVKNTGSLAQQSRYPITNSDNKQDVLISYDNYRYNLNYFYNRVKSNSNNQPIWLWGCNQIDKVINPKAVSFYGKKTLERLKGNYFMVRLKRNGSTNYDLDFKWAEQVTTTIR